MDNKDLENIQKIVEDIDEGWNPFQGWGPFLTQAQRREINNAERNRNRTLTPAQKAQVLARQRRETAAASSPDIDTSKGERSPAANAAKQAAAVTAYNKPINLRQPGSDPFAPVGSPTNPRPGQSLSRPSALAPGRAGDFSSRPASRPTSTPTPKPEKAYNVGDYGSLTKSQINQKYKQLSGDEAVKFGKAANQAIYNWKNPKVEEGVSFPIPGGRPLNKTPLLPGEDLENVPIKLIPGNTGGPKLPKTALKGNQKATTQVAHFEPEGNQLNENPAAVGAAIGIAAGGGYLLKKLLDQKKAVDSGKKVGGVVGNIQKRNQMLQQLSQEETEVDGELTEEMIYNIIVEYLISNGHAENLNEANLVIDYHDVDSLVRIVETQIQ